MCEKEKENRKIIKEKEKKKKKILHCPATDVGLEHGKDVIANRRCGS